MSEDFEIEILDEISESKDAQLPTNFLTFGEVEPDDVKVYIKQDVYKALEKLAASNTKKELGSIIIGDYSQALGKTEVIISNYVEAKYTDASASTLTFTHETWNYIHSEHEKLYPDKKIVGWQHTHPNYGIFLSNYDLFIQENYFNLPFQVAYVIDPIQNIRGFFQWKNGKIEKLKGYYIYDDPGKPIKIEQTKKKESSSAKTSKAIPILIAILCAAVIALSVFTVSLSKKYEQQLENQASILDALESQGEVINSQSENIKKLQEQLINSILDDSGKTTAASLIEMLESNDNVFENQDEMLSALKSIVASDGRSAEDIEYSTYTVKRGDTLADICKAAGIDYKSNIENILKVNNIPNENLIYAGQKILLPVVS